MVRQIEGVKYEAGGAVMDPGGRETTLRAMGYRATRTADALIVHDVEIFCACERDELKFSDEWVKAAVKKAQMRQAEGYMPPLHVRHHEPSTEATNAVIAAGVFKITRAAPITLKRKRVLAIFADLIITNEFVEQEILAKRLPFRSVEINNVEADPSIDSLALLDHEAPFLELPLLMVNQLSEAPGQTVAGANFRHKWGLQSIDDGSPMVACFRSGQRARLLFREVEPMPATEEKNDKQPELFADEDDEKRENMQDSDDEEKSEDMQDEAGGIDGKAIAKMIESGEISLADFDMIEAAIAKRRGSVEEPAEEEEPAPAAVPGESMRAKTVDENYIALAAKHTALEARFNEQTEQRERKEDVDAAVELFRDRPMGAKFRETIEKFHADFGRKAFRAYIEQLDKQVGIPRDMDGGDPSFSDTEPSEVVAAYANQGPGKLEQAASFAAEWRKSKSMGFTRLSEDAYVRTSMERANGKAKG